MAARGIVDEHRARAALAAGVGQNHGELDEHGARYDERHGNPPPLPSGSGQARQGRGLEQERQGDGGHAERAHVRILHDFELAFPRPPAQEPVDRVGEPIRVQGAREQYAERCAEDAGAQFPVEKRMEPGDCGRDDRADDEAGSGEERKTVGDAGGIAPGHVKAGERADGRNESAVAPL